MILPPKLETFGHTMASNQCIACLQHSKHALNMPSISAVVSTRALHQKIPTLSKQGSYILNECSRVAQWKRAGPITQRSVDRNHALLKWFFLCVAMLLSGLIRDRNISPGTHVSLHTGSNVIYVDFNLSSKQCLVGPK